MELRTLPHAEASHWYDDEYLTSDHWQQLRERALARAGHRCQVCNRSYSLCLHHRDYDRLGDEAKVAVYGNTSFGAVHPADYDDLQRIL